MHILLQDLRYALRQLARTPGFTAAVIFTLAIGIGVNTALFSRMDAVVLHPLAVPQMNRVVTVAEERLHSGFEQTALANYKDWTAASRSFEELAVRQDVSRTLTGAGDATNIQASLTSSGFFHVLRATSLAGRLYNESECQPGRDAVAVLNYGFWQRNFGGSPSVVGRRIELNQKSYTILGVLPKSMQYPAQTDVYLPFAPTPQDLANRSAHLYLVTGRLREGVSVHQAQAEMRTIAEHLSAAYPATNQEWSVHVEPLLDGINGPYTPAYFRLMMGATFFLLLIVCANVANLQLARGLARRSEIAMRLALGASRGRILRQLLTENLLLALAGMVGGIAFATIYLHITLITMPPRVANSVAGWSNTSLNGRVLVFSLLLAILTGVVAGLAPAIQALRVHPAEQLKSNSRSAIGAGGAHRLRNILAVAQIAMAVALVIGAALMSKGMNSWLHTADSYEPEKMLTFSVNLPESRYDTPQKKAQWYAQSLARLRALPGVTHAEVTPALPYDDNGWVRDVAIENRPAVPGKLQSALNLQVSAGYFDALRIPLVTGRVFDSGDTLGSRPVAIVSERFATQFFPAENPLGHRIRMGGQNSTEPWLTIVGIAKETNYSLWDTTPHAAVYMDATQLPPAGTEYIILTNGNPLSLAPAVHQTLSGIDPLLPLDTMESYAQLLRDNLTGLMYVASMLDFDALFALFLASIGIFGVMAALVNERTREIGLRLAMGATRGNVLSMILQRAGKLTALGLCVGLVLAFALAQGAANLLRGVRPDDPLVFLTIPAAIALIAIGTSWIPAWRAASVDPMITLREE